MYLSIMRFHLFLLSSCVQTIFCLLKMWMIPFVIRVNVMQDLRIES